MKDYQQQFIRFALDQQVLKFGEFTLKSGRISPYFLNAGLFSSGEAFRQLGIFYAGTIHENFTNQYDVLFGPAYKGISLAVAASIGLVSEYGINIPVSFNRKEEKDHGEGGMIIGENLAGKRVLLVDDVITAGKTIEHASTLINNAEGQLIGAVIALDRQEKSLESSYSAIYQVQQKFGISIKSIINCNNLIDYLSNTSTKHLDKMQFYLERLKEYRHQYGAINSPILENNDYA